MWSTRTLFILSSGLARVVHSAASFQPCPILGLDFIAPQNLQNATAFQAALQNLSSTFDNIGKTGQTPYGAFPNNETSFSVGVFDASSPGLLWSSAYTAPILENATEGTTNVTKDSIFRIGSGSKLITVYLFLLEAGPKWWNHPITEFIPRLADAAKACSATQDPIDCLDWDDVTLGALASHMAGVPRDYSTPAELLVTLLDDAIDPTSVGLPELPASDFPTCEWNASYPCPEDQYLTGLIAEHPSFAPFTSPIYSNAGFELLGFALENITGRSIGDMLGPDLLDKLNMTHTSYDTPSDWTYGVIPNGATAAGWNESLGNENPAGGYYASVTDLARMGQSILSATLLPENTIKQWMKPVALTASIRQAVGMPWEIWRVDTLTDHLFDLYTKAGDVGAYSSYFVLSPDYDIGFVVLAGGSDTNAAVQDLTNVIAETIFPALAQDARSQTQDTYGGTYQSNNTGLNSTMTFTTVPGEPGLVVTSWISNGTDLRQALATVQGATGGVDVRLYPSGLVQCGADGAQSIGFRAVIMPEMFVDSGGVFSNGCISWELVDELSYGNVGLDEFVFEVKDGKAQSVTPRALRITLPREA